jgi:threonine synthase
MVAFGWTDRMPRMVAAEIHGSIGAAMGAGSDALPDMHKTHDTVAVSIGATQSSFQALDILRRSHGLAVKVGDARMMHWQQKLAECDGLYVEPSSSATIAALEHLRSNDVIGRSDTVVVLLTASGLKDPATTERFLPKSIQVPAEMDAATKVLCEMEIFPS